MIHTQTKPSTLFVFLSVLFVLCAGLAFYSGYYLFLIIPFAVIIFYVGWQNITVVFFLLLLSLPFSFEYNFTPALATDIPDEFLMILTVFLFMATWCYYPHVIRGNMLQHPLLLLLAAWLVWIVITVVCSTHPLISFKYLLAKAWYCGAFIMAPLIIFKTKKNLIRGVAILVVAMIVVTFIIVIRHSFDGFSFATVNDAVYPFFRNHVNYSSMLVCLLPLLVVFARHSPTRIQRNILILITTFALVAVFFAYSRGAWLALLGGGLAYLLIWRRMLVSSYCLVILLAVGALFWIKKGDRYLQYAPDFSTTVYHPDFNEHLIATYKLKDVSTSERFYRWIGGIRMIKDDALTGFGPNTFYENYKPYTIPAYKTWVSDNKERSTVHNYFLLIAIEQGIPGLFLFLLLVGVMLYYAQHLYHRTKDIFYKVTAITTGVILVMIMVVNFLSDLVETDKIGSLFFLCLAVLVVTDINSKNKNLIPDN